jgi:PEGA domain
MTKKDTRTKTKKVHDPTVINSITRSMNGLYMDLLSKFLHCVITDGSTTMKKRFFLLCMMGIVLVLSGIVPVSAVDTPVISSITPAYGYNGASVRGVVMNGTGFNVTSSLGKVRLMKAGESNISATVTAYTNTSLTCTFPISGATAGDWDVVVVNRDLEEAVLHGGFTIKNAITLTSISPTSAQTNSTGIVTVVGTGLADIESMYLYNADYDNITADITSQTLTKIMGKINLADTTPDSYDLCVVDPVGTIECDLQFEIVTDQAGSIDVTSSPSGAKIYLDSAYVELTPYIIHDVSPGYHTVLIAKTGYGDWSERVIVKSGTTISVNGDLGTGQTAVATSLPTGTATTTVVKTSTKKVPTPWPTTTTPASPLEAPVVLGAIALGFVVLARKY